MKRFICMGLILLMLPLCARVDSAPPTDWPSVPASQGSDAFCNPKWVQMQQECETYQGPGEAYAQDQHHEVKADQWIQVFGQEEEWALILYSPSENIFRFGYCQMGALPESADIEPLSVWAKQDGTTESAWITSDPLTTLDEMLLPQLCPVTYLCALGDQWLYVELIQMNGKPRRGFIRPQSLYEHDMFGDVWVAATPCMAADATPETTIDLTQETAVGTTPESEPSPTPVPVQNLSENAAVTLAKDVLLHRFHFTQEQIDALQINSTNWSGDNFPVCWLLEFYKGDYVSGEHVISVGIDANSGDLRGCYVKQNGFLVWVDVDALTDTIIAEAYPSTTPVMDTTADTLNATPAPLP